MTTIGKHLGGVRTLADIEARCDMEGECWEWALYTSKSNVPVTRFDGRARPVRRVVWQLLHGAVPSDMCVTYTCGNFRCVNPAHLQMVSPAVTLHRFKSPTSELLRAARISATKRAKMGVSKEVIAAVKAQPYAHALTLAESLGISESTVYKLRRQAVAQSPWAGLMRGAV